MSDEDKTAVALTSKQIRHLRALAHDLKAVVQIGQKGVTHEVVRQIEQQLEIHELIKVKTPFGAEARQEAAGRVAAETGSQLVQVIGKVVVLYRPHPEEPQIRLP